MWIEHVIHSYGLVALFAAVMLESMGVPVPGETALVSAALYAGATQKIGLAPIILVASAAAIIGDNIGYLIGRTIGLRLIVRYGRRIGVTGERIRIGEYMFLRHGGKIVFFGRFVAFLRIFAALLAGANRMPWGYFVLMNALGGICWATLVGGSAYLFGDKIRLVEGPIKLLLVAVAVGLVVAGIVFLRRHERELEKRARLALAQR